MFNRKGVDLRVGNCPIGGPSLSAYSAEGIGNYADKPLRDGPLRRPLERVPKASQKREVAKNLPGGVAKEP